MKLPCPPLAWSAMLSSWIFWYSGVNGACWAGPNALVGSYLTPWPPSRGLIGSHWPFQLGYFISAAGAPTVAVSAAASTSAPIELPLRHDIAVSPCTAEGRDEATLAIIAPWL